MNTNFFSLKLFGRRQDIPAESRDIRQKSLISLISRDIPNFLAPTPSCGRPLPHRKISGLKSLGLGSFFVPEKGLWASRPWVSSMVSPKVSRGVWGSPRQSLRGLGDAKTPQMVSLRRPQTEQDGRRPRRPQGQEAPENFWRPKSRPRVRRA